MKVKACTKCGQHRELENFNRSPSSKDGRTSRCKWCRREDTRQYTERRKRAETLAVARGQEHLRDAEANVPAELL